MTVREATVEAAGIRRPRIVVVSHRRGAWRRCEAGSHREAGCPTVSLVDGDGKRRMHSVRMGPDAGVEQGDAESRWFGRRGRGGARPAPCGPDGGQARRWGEGQLDVPHPRAARGGRVHRLLPRRRASQRRLRHRPRDRRVPKAAAQFKKYRHLLRQEPDGRQHRHSGVGLSALEVSGQRCESHRCWATSAAAATACATPMPRLRGCPSAPASPRRPVQDAWSPSGSNVTRHAIGAAWRDKPF